MDLFTLGGGKREKQQEHKEEVTPTIPDYTSTRVTTQDPQVTNTIKGKIQWQSSSQIQGRRGLDGSLLLVEVLKSTRILP